MTCSTEKVDGSEPAGALRPNSCWSRLGASGATPSPLLARLLMFTVDRGLENADCGRHPLLKVVRSSKEHLHLWMHSEERNNSE